MSINLLLGVLSIMFSLTACAAPLVKINVNVHEYDGKPVEGADVKGSFFQDQIVNQIITSSHQGSTDNDGNVKLSGHENIYVDLKVNKSGYYTSKQRVVVRGDSEPNVFILLREKNNPTKMFAKKVLLIARETRKSGEQFGYDLVIGDFVYPHGKGSVSDILITHTFQRKDMWNYSYKFLINFTNPYDGMQTFFVENNVSDFKSDYMAPEKGYRNNWVLKGRRNGIDSKLEKNQDLNKNYYLRVRTEIDGSGNVVSAYYGKIYGDFPKITYYLNSSVNDLNIEFNPDENLFKDLNPDENVVTP